MSSYISGPVTSTILQDFGATVYKIEAPAGDPFRLAGASYSSMNRDKAHAVIDLKTDGGREQFHRLAGRADVVIDNTREGVAAQLGVSYQDLRGSNEKIIRCGIGAWGEGSLRSSPGFDPLLQSRSGLMTAQGGPGAPTIQAVPIHDKATATLSALGVLLALLERTRSHLGQEVLTTLARTSVSFQAAEFTSFADRPPTLQGNPAFLGEAEVHRLYRCSDGWIAAGAGAAAIATTLARDGSSGASDPAAGVVSSAETALANLTVGFAIDQLALAGIPAVRAISRLTLFDDPALLESGLFFRVSDPDFGEITAVRSFAQWSGLVAPSSARMHALGEDTAWVLGGSPTLKSLQGGP
jgi:crotonobetainyl-CoA:carnitine CoA-transferase CaiB-like acyl-CoA transferase